MPETCENWFGLLYNDIYYTHQTREIYQVLPYLVDFKAPGSFEIHWVRQHLVNVVLFGLKGLCIFRMTVKIKSNLFKVPVYSLPNYWHCMIRFMFPVCWSTVGKTRSKRQLFSEILYNGQLICRRHQTITWRHFDLPSSRSYGTRLIAFYLQMLLKIIAKLQ